METRIQRHKNYRAELIKEGSEVSLKEKPLMTTTTLPIKDVIDMVEDEKNLHYFKRKRYEKVIWYILLVLLLIACVVGLILLGILAFGGN